MCDEAVGQIMMMKQYLSAFTYLDDLELKRKEEHDAIYAWRNTFKAGLKSRIFKVQQQMLVQEINKKIIQNPLLNKE